MTFPPQGSGGGISAAVAGRARYTVSGSPTINTGTTTIVDFSVSVADTLTKGSITTGAGWKYTASEAVELLVTVRIGVASRAWATLYFTGNLYKNGSELTNLDQFSPDAGTSYGGWVATMPVTLSASDYIDVRLYHDESGTCTINTSAQGFIEIVELA